VSPYEVLGVQPGASEVQIRDAFHRLAIHYHPDKVHHLGEEFERVAKEKFSAAERCLRSPPGRAPRRALSNQRTPARSGSRAVGHLR
jgi:preprotein translocase subunit Sec63